LLIEIIFSTLSSFGSVSLLLSLELCLLCFLIATRSILSLSELKTDLFSLIVGYELFDFSANVLVDLKVESVLLLF